MNCHDAKRGHMFEMPRVNDRLVGTMQCVACGETRPIDNETMIEDCLRGTALRAWNEADPTWREWWSGACECFGLARTVEVFSQQVAEGKSFLLPVATGGSDNG